MGTLCLHGVAGVPCFWYLSWVESFRVQHSFSNVSGAHFLKAFIAVCSNDSGNSVLPFLKFSNLGAWKEDCFCFHSDFTICFFSPWQGESKSADTDNAPQVPPTGMNVSLSLQQCPMPARPVTKHSCWHGALT